MKIICLFFFCLSAPLCFGQSTKDSSRIATRFKNNGMFIEMLGNGGAYSINYERRIKIGKHYVCPSIGYAYLFPLFNTVNGRLLFVTGTGKKSKFEIGPGIIHLYEPEGNVDVAFNLNVGTRNEYKNGSFFRINALAFLIGETAYDPKSRAPYQKLTLMPWIGISLGQAF